MTDRNVLDVFSCKDLVAVITGGGSGIGLMMTKAIADAGAKKIYILGRRSNVLEEAAKHKPDVIIPLKCDITSKSDLQAAAERVNKEAGYINVLINNAGISGPSHLPVHGMQTIEQVQERLWKDDPKDWQSVYDCNVSAVYFTSVAFLKLLDNGNKQGNVPMRSQIVTITSIASFNRKISSGLPYHTSKAAATHMGKMLATLLAPYKIRSNVIAPGIYPSDMTNHDQEQEYPVEQIPHGTKGHPEDMAGAVLYMVSRAGAYLNGAVNVTDGGRLAVHPATF